MIADAQTEGSVLLRGASAQKRRHFVLYWTAVCTCSLTVHLTGYALGVWCYEVTGSVTLYALFPLLVILPILVVSPFAGVLADRMENRRVMLGSILAVAATLVPVYLLVLQSEPRFVLLYSGVFLLSLFNAVLFPALSALATRLLDREFLGKASAMLQMSIMLPGLLSPILAGLLLTVLDISAVVSAALVAQVIPVLLAVGLYRSGTGGDANPTASSQHVFRDLREGFRYLKEHRGLRELVTLMFLTHVCTSMLQASAIPFFLEVTTKAGMSVMMAAAALGMIAGVLFLVLRQGPRRRARALMGMAVFGGAQICVAGSFRHVAVISVFCGSAYFSHALANVLEQTIWQFKVDPKVLGRVISIRRVLLLSGVPISYLSVGPLVEHVLVPFKPQISTLSLGLFSDTGNAGVFGFLWVVLGLTIVVIHGIGLRRPHLRGLDQDEETSSEKVVS